MTRKREFENMVSLATELITKSRDELGELRVQEDGFRERERVLERKRVRHFFFFNNYIDEGVG
jgi:hypothetical protein